MEKEFRSLIANGTWELVDPPSGKRVLPNRWVYSIISGAKSLDAPDIDLEKARLVARGDLQRAGEDYRETYAPVVKLVSLRILLTWTKLRGLHLKHWDVVSAFLHGDIDVEIYMRQPEGFDDGSGRVCKLKKALYGLCQAARQFYVRLDSILQEVGFVRLSGDWAIWLAEDDSGAFIAGHVDDMAVGGKVDQLSTLKSAISKHIELKDLGDLRVYLSISILSTPSVFYLYQTKYIDKVLREFNMTDAHPVATPMLEDDRKRWDDTSSSATPLLDLAGKKRFQAVIGCLLYIMHATRPDIANVTIRLSQYASGPRAIHWEGAKRVLRYLKGTRTYALTLGDVHSLRRTHSVTSGATDLVGFFDAAHADNGNRKSTCGYVFLLHGSPISWVSRVQRSVALSTTEAEFVSGTEAAREAIWLKGILDYVCRPVPVKWPIHLCGDNQGALALARNPAAHHRTKHIELRERFITELVSRNVIVVSYVHTSQMIADGFTRCLPKDRHLEFLSNIGVLPLPQFTTTVKHTIDEATDDADVSSKADSDSAPPRKRLIPFILGWLWDRRG